MVQKLICYIEFKILIFYLLLVFFTPCIIHPGYGTVQLLHCGQNCIMYYFFFFMDYMVQAGGWMESTVLVSILF